MTSQFRNGNIIELNKILRLKREFNTYCGVAFVIFLLCSIALGELTQVYTPLQGGQTVLFQRMAFSGTLPSNRPVFSGCLTPYGGEHFLGSIDGGGQVGILL